MSRKASPPAEPLGRPASQRTQSKRQDELPADAAATGSPSAQEATSLGPAAAPRRHTSRRSARSLRSPSDSTAFASTGGPGPSRRRPSHPAPHSHDVPVQASDTPPQRLSPASAEHPRPTQPGGPRLRASSSEPSEGSATGRRRPRRSPSLLSASTEHPSSAVAEPRHSSHSSQFLIPPSQSYPFLAQAPPERTSRRQSKRRSSMPNRSRTNTASPSPTPRSPGPSTSDNPVSRRSASASGSRPKRQRADIDVEQPATASSSSQGQRRGETPPRRRGSRGTGRRSLPSAQGPSQSPGQNDNPRYQLIIVQQPAVGCAFGSNLLSRIPCGPPLILTLKVRDASGREVSVPAEEPWLACQTSLVTENGQLADMLSPTTPQGTPARTPAPPESPRQGSRSVRRSSRNTSASSSASTATQAAAAALNVPSTAVRMLYGSLIASPQRFRSQEGPVRTYFVFPELCVRAMGIFRLRASLIRLPRTEQEPAGGPAETMPSSSAPPSGSDVLAQVTSEPFDVSLAQDYAAPYITDTTRWFARQGAALPLPAGEQSAD